MRNKEKDALEMAQRRDAIIDAGFRLFSSRAIDPVTMQNVADEAKVGIATVYRYFPTKIDLVIAISAARWRAFFADLNRLEAEREIPSQSAAVQFEFCLDCFLYMYKNYRTMLRFNYDFNFYIANAGATREQLKPNSEAVIVFAEKFHRVWLKAQTDGSMRPDVSEMDLFSSSIHIMLAVAARYAAGLIYHAASEEDDLRELETLKQMILHEYVLRK